MTLAKLDGKALKRALGAMSSRTSPGIDGWRVAELKALPRVCFDRLADIFNAVETHGVWPLVLLTALVTLIPKGEHSVLPLEQRPITVTSVLYRLWAKARLGVTMEWQETWIAASQAGFRTAHGTDHVTWTLSVEMEEALMAPDKELWGFSLDLAKCFDRVPQELVFGLAEEWGMDARLLRGLRAAYTGMVSRFRLGQGVGESFKPANGIKQGCPLSVILLNLLLAVWSAVIDEGGRAKAKSYADDAYATAAEEEEVKEAVRKTDVFLDDTDMEAKASKCAGLSSGSTPTQFQMQGGAIPHKDEFRCLGGDIIGRRTPRRQVVGAVLTKRVRDALPMALFGCSYAAVGSKDLTQLRSAIMEGIWGSGRRSRSNAIVCYLLSPTMVDPLAWVPHMRLRTFLRLNCCSGEEEDQRHMWWLCSRWSRLRSETARYVPHLDTWPECFVQCGIVTEDFREPPGVDRTVMAGQVQRMMALISMERCDIDKGTKLVSRLSMREKPEYPFGWRPDGASYDPLAKALRLQVTRKDHDELLLLGLRTWLRGVQRVAARQRSVKGRREGEGCPLDADGGGGGFSLDPILGFRGLPGSAGACANRMRRQKETELVPLLPPPPSTQAWCCAAVVCQVLCRGKQEVLVAEGADGNSCSLSPVGASREGRSNAAKQGTGSTDDEGFNHRHRG